MALGAPVVSIVNYLASEGVRVSILSFHTTKESFDESVEIIDLSDRLFKTDSINRKIDRAAAHRGAYAYLRKHHDRFDLIWITAWQYTLLPQILKLIGYKGKLAYQFRELELDKLKYLKHFDFVLMPEVNRMWIAYFLADLKTMPVFLPNIPFIPALAEEEPNPLLEKLKAGGKKILLYQGLIEYGKRCVSELLNGVRLGPEAFHLVVMPSASSKKAALQRMELEITELGLTGRVHILPTRVAPEHLQIVRQADVGIGLYRPTSLNQVYAAPNRLHEFAAFSIPLILPDFPSFNTLSKIYPFAINVVDPEKPANIADVLRHLEIDGNIAEGKANAVRFRKEQSDYNKIAGEAWSAIRTGMHG